VIALSVAGLTWWARRGADSDDMRPHAGRSPSPVEELFLVPREVRPLSWHDWSDSTFARARDTNKPILAFLDAAWSESAQLYAATLAASETARAALETDVVAIRVDIDRRPDVHARFHTTFDAVPTLIFLTPAGRVWDVRDPLTASSLTQALHELRMAHAPRDDSELALLEAVNPASQSSSAPSWEERAAEILDALADAWPHPEEILELDTPVLMWDAFGFLRAYAERMNAPAARSLFLQGLRQLLASRLLRDGAVWREVEGAEDRVSRAAFLETNASLLDDFVTAAQWTNDDVYRDAARRLGDFLMETLWSEHQGLFRAAQGTLVVNENGWPILTGEEYASMRDHEHAAELQPSIVSVFPSAANARACVALLHANEQVAVAQRALGVMWNVFERRGVLPHDFGVDARGELSPSAHDFTVDYAEVGMAFLSAAALAAERSDANRWIERARALAERLLADFALPDTGLFRDARVPAAAAPERMRMQLTPLVDNARAARFLSLMTAHTGDTRYEAAARAALEAWNHELWNRGVWEASEFGLAILAGPR
jgi:uncharacterized protein YyaL (SSP411 family)